MKRYKPGTCQGVEVNLMPLSGLSRNAFSRVRMKSSFFVTFNTIISHIIPENFVEIPWTIQEIWRFSSNFQILWHLLNAKKLMAAPYYRWCQDFFYLQPTLNKLFKNCINLWRYWINSSWNMKGRKGQVVNLPPIRKKSHQKVQPYYG